MARGERGSSASGIVEGNRGPQLDERPLRPDDGMESPEVFSLPGLALSLWWAHGLVWLVPLSLAWVSGRYPAGMGLRGLGEIATPSRCVMQRPATVTAPAMRGPGPVATVAQSLSYLAGLVRPRPDAVGDCLGTHALIYITFALALSSP